MEKDIHKIHNYIRDYTKISNEDKCFFIACILISIKKLSFYKILENYDTNNYIYDLIKQNLIDFDIDFTVFEFLRNDKNNTHFFNIIKMVKYVYDNNPSNDILNNFYSEFVKYNNTDGKNLGIVLTPDHIVDLMIEMLQINKNDIFLDLCSGTGSFPLKALQYKPAYIIACEYQNKLYTLLNCNMILRDIDLKVNNIIKNDCFKEDFNKKFKATKSAINPPYGMKDKKELDFVIKQLESVIEGGLVCAIIPCSNLSKSILRNKIFDISLIKKIVICNNDLFYPYAGVKTCIILLEKYKNVNKTQSVIIDNFENDGFEIKRNYGRILINQPLHDESKIIISKDDETWLRFNIDSTIDKKMLNLKLLEIEYNSKRLNYLNKYQENEIKFSEFKEFTISELFNITKIPLEYKYNGNLIYEISAKNNNNGIKAVIRADKKTFTGNKIVLITGGNGGAGLAYYQENDFKISSATIVLDPKSKLKMDKKIGIYIAEELSKYKLKYSRGFQWNLQRIKKDVIELPIMNNNINYEYIYSLYD